MGVKGAEGAVGAVKSVSDGMSNLWSRSTAAKIAIVGAFYELEQMFSASNKTATSLAEFTTLTGMSTKAVQEYNAAIQLFTGKPRGVEQTISTFTDLQKSIRDIQFGSGDIVGKLQQMFHLIGRGNVSPDELKKWAPNIQLLIQHMREFAETAKSMNIAPDVINRTLSGILHDKDLISTIIGGGATPAKLAAADSLIMSDKQVNQALGGARAWAKMNLEIEHVMDQFNAIDGAKLAKNLEPLVNQILNLTLALVDLSDKVKVFKALGVVIEAVTGVLEGPGGEAVRAHNRESGEAVARAERIVKENEEAQDWVLKQLHSTHRRHLTSEQGGPSQEVKNLTKYYNTYVHIHTKTDDPKKHGKMAADGFNAATTAYSH